jgi:hypothetical protein
MPEDGWEQIEVEDILIVPVVEMTKRAGRAAFQVCTKFRYGVMDEYWIYPSQQPEQVGHCWHWKRPGPYRSGWETFGFSSYHGLPYSGPWRASWCRVHRAVLMDVYVPNGTKFVRIDGYGLGFLAREW